jgi:predicted unusual protein kinase regulating ubiquinone biosynthesis (AarF/ABC1/UbiB family)
MPDGPIPRGRIQRVVRPAALTAKAAVAQGGTWALSRFGRRDDKDQLRRAIKSAEQVTELMGDMKGAFMKVGQLLSLADASMLPAEVRDLLATLQADAPPMAYELAAAVVEEELGAPPQRAFDWFSAEPMAAASIGQVHAARIGDREVVVKIQYPGVADAVRADLNNAGLMAAAVSLVQTFAGGLIGRVDVRTLAEEIRDRVLEELDYEQEAANQQAFAALYRGHRRVRIPEVVPERSTGRVLTMEYHDGMRWAAALQQPQELKDRWAEVIHRFVFGTLYRHGLFNADPHPGNYLFHEDGGVTFLDFGCVKRLDPPTLAALTRMGRAIVDDDEPGLMAVLVEAGFFTPDHGLDPAAVVGYLRPAYAPVLAPQPYRYTHDAAAEMIRAQIGLIDEYRKLAVHFDLPRDYLFLGRITLGVQSVLTGLEGCADWRAIIEEIWGARNTDDTTGS